MIVCRALLILAFGFFTEAAMAGKTYDLLIKLHNRKIKSTAMEAIASYNDKIHGILGGSRGFSKHYLTPIEKANTTYIAVHAALTTPGTVEDTLLNKVFTDTNLKHLDTPNSKKIIIHYVKLAILYLATRTVDQVNCADPTECSDLFRLMVKGKIGRLAGSIKLPTNLKTALTKVTETDIANTLQRLNFGEIYHFIKRQIRRRMLHDIPEMELIGSSLPSLAIEECHPGRGKCGERGRWKGMHPPHPGRPPFMGPGEAPYSGIEGLLPPPHPDMGKHGHGHRHHHPHGPRPFGPPPVFDMGRPPPPHHHGGHHGRHWKKTWLNEFSSPTASTTLEADEDE